MSADELFGYPSKAQVEAAISAIHGRGVTRLTFESIANQIERDAGLRPGDDVVAMLIRHYGIEWP